MENKDKLWEVIKKCRRRMILAQALDWGILAAAAGGVLGMLCELASLVWRFYYVHLAAGLCFGAGFLAGAFLALWRRADMRQAALRLDSFGLKERVVTAYEQRDREGELVRLQREDAFSCYEKRKEQIRIPVLPNKKHILALILSAAAVAGLGFLPSPVREDARLQHQVRAEAEEELEKLEEFLEALEGVDPESLGEEDRMELQELAEAMKLSREELAAAATWESLAAAREKLDFKYGQADRGLESLAGRMENPAGAGIAAAQALAKATAGQQMASAGSGASPDGGGDGEGSEDGNGEGQGNGNNDGNGEGQGNGSNGGNGEGQGSGSGDGNGEGQGSGSNGGNGEGQGSGSGNGNSNGSGSGQGNGNGNGSGNGQGNGNGNGNGQGNGSGNGNGSGGRGTGSSSASHDYVSIPNALGSDSSLTGGGSSGNQDSDYYRQQNGLAWEGEHVDYNSVIGEYTDSAYEGIANGKYPSGMESVIRDYFENLNQ